MRRREELMEEQERVNKEKDIKTQRQEKEEITGKDKLSGGAIRKMGTKGEISTKPKGTPKKERYKKE